MGSLLNESEILERLNKYGYNLLNYERYNGRTYLTIIDKDGYIYIILH